MTERVQPADTFRQIVSLYRKHAVSLLLLGAIILTPLALVEVLTKDIGEVETDDGFLLLSNLAILSLRSAAGLLGEVFYSGAVALLVLHVHESVRLDLRDVFQRLPFTRLVAVDLLYAAIVLVGLILLVIPGLIFMTWFWLAGAVVEVEDRRPIAALRRSRNLIKGNFWRAFAVVLPLSVGTALISSLGAHLTFDLLGHSRFAEWMSESLWDVLLTPFYALGVIVLLVRLSGRRLP